MSVLDFLSGGKIQEIEQNVSSSFTKVKQDTDALYQWVSFLYQQNKQLSDENAALRRLTEEQKLAVNELKVIVTHVPKSAAEIKQIVDAHYSFEPVISRIRHIEQKLELLEMRQKPSPLVEHHASVQTVQQASSHPAPIQHAPVHIPVEKGSSLREKLMRKIARNSKEYVKNLVMGLVHKYSRIGALQLREMIVEEQGLCSKSSFYRILEEMEDENKLNVVSDGKHTIYVAAQH
ncbi:hypothetical protein J4219_08940 [Candidatus Woesearchaeota archaeon]|nr:hypothetical protein [Candidatus Woesearchaeota archaeon]